MKQVSAYLLIGIYGHLIWLWYQRRKAIAPIEESSGFQSQ